MKRSGFKPRTKPLAPGKPPARGGQLRRGARVKPVNRKRKAKSYARSFGEEADAVRAMPCIACIADATDTGRFAFRGSEPAHNPSRGAGGGRMDQTPLCKAHHDEQHAIGVKSFEQRYGLDLRAEADRVAISHASPLGIRGLAQRWAAACKKCSGAGGFELAGSSFAMCHACDGIPSDRLDSYECEVLLGWVRRELAREVERSPRFDGSQINLQPDDRELLAHHVAVKLGAPFTDDFLVLSWALCDAAGWPGVGS